MGLCVISTRFDDPLFKNRPKIIISVSFTTLSGSSDVELLIKYCIWFFQKSYSNQIEAVICIIPRIERPLS